MGSRGQLLALTCLAVLASAASQCVMNTSMPGRLPSSVIPVHYGIHLDLPAPDSEATAFAGYANISVDVRMSTTCIVFHAAPSLTVMSVSFTDERTKSILVGTFVYDSDTQMVTATFTSKPLPIGMGALYIKYKAKIRDDGTGIFRCDNKYEPLSEAGLSMWSQSSSRKSAPKSKLVLDSASPKMFATQFEQTDARSVFPCFDEPALKATYQALIVVASPQTAYTVLFNSPVSHHDYDGTAVHYWFESTSKPMSTYLVAIAVGTFDVITGTTSSGTLMRIYTPPTLGSWGQYALNISIATVEYYEKIFQFNYSNLNTKLDQISVSGIIDDGMENQGLITYSPGFLLCDPATCLTPDYEMITLVVTHELCHQWLGDTITAPWWTSLYLNEGFARFYQASNYPQLSVRLCAMQYIATIYLHPEWSIITTNALGPLGSLSYFGFTYLRAMRLDFQGLGAPIVIPENSTVDNHQIFYEKGASVNRMTYFHLGADTFNADVASNINKHAYTNPGVSDLLTAFSRTEPQMAERLTPWLRSAGFPVILVSFNSDTGVITFTQAFLSQSEAFAANITLDGPTTTLTLPRGGPWRLHVDPRSLSFSIPCFEDPYMWNLWFEDLVDLPSHAYRIPSVQKVFFLARTAWVNITVAYSATMAVGQMLTQSDSSLLDTVALAEMTWTEWQTLLGLIYDIPQSTYWNIAIGLGQTIQRTTQFVGLAGGNETMSQLRTVAYSWAVFGRLPSALVALNTLFEADPTKIPADLQAPAFTAAAISGGTAFYTLINLYQSHPPSDFRTNVVIGLSALPNVAYCTDALYLLANDTASSMTIITNMLALNSACRSFAWSYFTSRLAPQRWRSEGCRFAYFALVNYCELTRSSASSDILPVLQSYGSSSSDLSSIYSLFEIPAVAACVPSSQQLAVAHVVNINTRVAELAKSSSPA